MVKSNSKFIERGTHYNFREGRLSVYQTNCRCEDVEFNFDRHVITMMLSGHKSVKSQNGRIEFYPGTVIIPEKNSVLKIDIKDASLSKPTKCLVLDISPQFLEEFYMELLDAPYNIFQDYDTLPNSEMTRFFLNDDETIESFKRLYKSIKMTNLKSNGLINTIILKELLIRIFHTEAGYLLIDNFQNEICDKKIRNTINYIKTNLTNKITIDDLVNISGVGKTDLFVRFKNTVGITPMSYIIKQRIDLSKKFIKKLDDLQSVAFQSGFNTYEHFCNSFRKIEGICPSAYRKNNLVK